MRKCTIGLLVLLLCAAGACKLPEMKESPGKVLMDPGKTIQVTIPSGWKEDRELHESAELQASQRAKELYIIILSESKQDFQQMTLEGHSKITRDTLMGNIKSAELSAPVSMTVGGYPAVQYEISGFVDNLGVVYLHTTVESAGSYHQILTWTLKSMAEKNKPILQKVTESFQEVTAGVK